MHREANQFDYGRPSDPVYGETDPIDPAEAIGPGPNASDDSAGANPLDELEKLMARARAGDAAVLPRLRELLDENAGLLGSFGDVAAHTEAAWIGVMAGGDLGLAEAINVQIAARKRELGGSIPDASGEGSDIRCDRDVAAIEMGRTGGCPGGSG